MDCEDARCQLVIMAYCDGMRAKSRRNLSFRLADGQRALRRGQGPEQPPDARERLARPFQCGNRILEGRGRDLLANRIKFSLMPGDAGRDRAKELVITYPRKRWRAKRASPGLEKRVALLSLGRLLPGCAP